MSQTTRGPIDRIRRARVATFIGFATLGGLMYTWSTSVIALREQLGLSGSAGDLRFGVIALSAGIAAAIGSFAVGPFADRFGPRAPITVCAVIYPLLLMGLGLSRTVELAIPLGAALGLFRGAMDTTLNAHGIEVERYYGRSIMSSFHACFSLGGFVIGGVGSWLAGQYTASATVSFSVLGTAMLVCGTVATLWMLRKDELLPTPARDRTDSGGEPQGASQHSATSSAVLLLTIAFGVLLLGSMTAENVVGDWGQEYLHRVSGATVSLAGGAVFVFAGCQTAGRLVGDPLAQAFGRPTVVFVSALLGIAGLCLAVLANRPAASLVGFGALGLGLSSIAPLMLSSAGRADAANAGRNIGIVNSIGFSAFLVSPAVITLVVTHFGLHRLLLFPLIMLLPLAICGPLLMSKAERSQSGGAYGVQPSAAVRKSMGAA
jgi:MFS family permease